MLQEVFNCLLSNEAREEFLHGVRGAPTLTENELKNLDTFFNLVSINRLNLSTTFNVVVYLETSLIFPVYLTFFIYIYNRMPLVAQPIISSFC